MRFAAVVFLVLLLIPAGAIAGALEDAKAAFDRHDYQTAFKLTKPLADQGNSFAQQDLGKMYEMGWGVTQDYREAAKLYRRAAEQGMFTAQYNLGVLYS